MLLPNFLPATQKKFFLQHLKCVKGCRVLEREDEIACSEVQNGFKTNSGLQPPDQAIFPQKQMYIFCTGNHDTRRKIISYLPANAYKIPWNL
jgi:hypothetical protein